MDQTTVTAGGQQNLDEEYRTRNEEALKWITAEANTDFANSGYVSAIRKLTEAKEPPQARDVAGIMAFRLYESYQQFESERMKIAGGKEFIYYTNEGKKIIRHPEELTPEIFAGVIKPHNHPIEISTLKMKPAQLGEIRKLLGVDEIYNSKRKSVGSFEEIPHPWEHRDVGLDYLIIDSNPTDNSSPLYRDNAANFGVQKRPLIRHNIFMGQDGSPNGQFEYYEDGLAYTGANADYLSGYEPHRFKIDPGGLTSDIHTSFIKHVQAVKPQLI